MAGNIYSDIFKNASHSAQQRQSALLRMQQMRANDLLRKMQQQAVQQRYLQGQETAAENRTYQRGRDATRDTLARDKFEYQKMKEGAKGVSGATPGTTYQRRNALTDLAVNRYLNEANPPTAEAVGLNGDRSTSGIYAANNARDRFLSTPQKGVMPPPAGPARPFTGGAKGFDAMNKRADVIGKAVGDADLKYGSELQKYPGITKDFLSARGEQINYPQLDAKGKPVPPEQVLVQGPSGVVSGTRQDWDSIMTARAKMAMLLGQQKQLPQGYPSSLPVPVTSIADYYPPDEREMMMPRAASSRPAPPTLVAEEVPYGEPALPVADAGPTEDPLGYDRISQINAPMPSAATAVPAMEAPAPLAPGAQVRLDEGKIALAKRALSAPNSTEPQKQKAREILSKAGITP